MNCYILILLYNHNNTTYLRNRMNPIFINCKNSKTLDLHRLLFTLTNKLNLKRSDKYISLSNLNVYYTYENIKKSYKNNEFKKSTLTQTEDFELPDGSYSVSDIQDYFEYILKKHGEKTNNPSIKTYVNKIENRITLIE